MIAAIAGTHTAVWYIAATLGQVARADVPDMPDRIIAATARYLDVPVISRDGRIRGSGISTIW